MQQRLPGGHVVGQAGDGLQLIGFQGRAVNLRLGRLLRGIEETADGDGSLFFEQQAKLAGKLMLACNPFFIGGGLEVKNSLPSHRRGSKRRTKREKCLPLESGKVGVQHRRRNGIKQGHRFSVLKLS